MYLQIVTKFSKLICYNKQDLLNKLQNN